MVAGVCYGMVANNLPPPSDVVQLYKNKGIAGMRIYSPDPTALTALRNSGISLIIDIGGTDQLAYLAGSGSNAAAWVQAHVQAYQGLTIKYIVAGNEVQGADQQNIVPAIRNLNGALSAVGLGGIEVSTAARFDAVASSFPPSDGVFAQPYMTDVARLLASTGAPLLVNIYPYFAYRDDPVNIQLNYATFQPGATPVRDSNNGLTYTCLFDAMVDAVYAALEKAGTPGLRVVVSESGWPSASGFAATADNARAYNQGLINHVGGGTPKRPGTLETYIFSMFNENYKLGDLVEKRFGLFNPDKSPAYPIQFN